MCGIVGIASKLPQSNRAWLSKGRDLMFHRGPDDFGEWWSLDGRVGLAHRRLSIIDLSKAGHQPMQIKQNGFHIVFNGEIYNFLELKKELIDFGHSFESNSDTEVILKSYVQWGGQCLSHLDGMFAFAIYDSKKEKVFLARDRVGEKPLFYRISNGELRFASELKAILADSKIPRVINKEAFDCYLSMGFAPGNLCLLEGFHKLPPAHAMVFSLKSANVKIWQYWQIPEFNEKSLDDFYENDLIDELEELLAESVNRQMVADVPVGLLLSGGIDSSLIVAMAAKKNQKLRTFTIGFPGHGNLDETHHARLIANHFNTDHVELMADQNIIKVLPQLARQFDEPIVDSSMIPTFLVSQMVSKHCKVALGGDGGDELFGGYSHYSRLQWIQKRTQFMPLSARRAFVSAIAKFLPIGFKGRNWLLSFGEDLNNTLPLIASYFDADSRQSLLSSNKIWKTKAEKIRSDRVPKQNNLLQRATRMDFLNYLPEDILVKVDRTSMLNSLEIRSPFLSADLIDFAFRNVPSCLKSNEGEKKILLKKFAKKILPPNFDFQRKQGFSLPLASWLKEGPFRELFNDVLRDPNSIFNPNTIDNIFKGQDMGRSNSERLFALTMFELWRNEYNVSF